MLTEEAMEAIFTCLAAEQLGKVFAPNAEWQPACEEAREKGWLSREQRDEHVAYQPTTAAHTALNLNALRRDEPADERRRAG